MFRSKQCFHLVQQSIRATTHVPFSKYYKSSFVKSIATTISPFNYYHSQHRNIQQQIKKEEKEEDIEVTIQILEDTLSIIQYGVKKIFLIGCHHMSPSSAQQVREVIEEVKPEAIVLEICEERAEYIEKEIKLYKKHLDENTKISAKFRKQLSIGAEFRVGIEEGKRINANIIYGDIDQKLLVERFNYGLKKSLQDPHINMSDKYKLKFGVVSWKQWFGMKMNPQKTIEIMKTREKTSERIKFMKEKGKYIQNGIMEERNDIMALSLKECKENLIVGIVGMDHMEGIEERFQTKFKNVDLSKHEQARKQMIEEQSFERLQNLCTPDTWIGPEYQRKEQYSSMQPPAL